MTYKLTKDHVTNWDTREPNKKPIFNDDQDIYISERSSTASLDEYTPSPKLYNKQLSPPPPNKPKARKEPHNLRYDYNELPENSIPLATQAKQAKMEEKQRRKNMRKAPPGQGSLAQLPETEPPDVGSNYYPYWYYYKVKNPDWIARHRQTENSQLIPYDYVDPSQYVHPPALSTPSKKTRRHHRKSNHDSTMTQYNPERKDYGTVRKTSEPTFQENYRQPRSLSKEYTPLKDASNGEYSDQFSTQSRPKKREQLKTENDWNDHYIQALTTSKSSSNSNNLSSNSNTSKHRSKHHHHHSKETQNILPNENKNHRRHHHRHSKEMQNILPNENKNHHHSPSQQQHQHQHHYHSSSQEQHHHHSPSQHHHHSPSQQHHHLRYSPTKEYENSEFHVMDASFKKSERTPYFQPTHNSFHPPPPVIYNRNSFQASPPAIYNQSSYLPPIIRDDNHYHRPNPIDYYSTPTLNHDWKERMKTPKIYSTDRRTNFYDRYLNSVITEKIT